MQPICSSDLARSLVRAMNVLSFRYPDRTKWECMSNKKSPSRQTRQRGAILQVLKGKKSPVAATEILKAVQSKLPDTNKTTVYRTLERLVGEQLVETVLLNSGVAHYELSAEHHHHHFVCNSCTKIFCIEGCPPELKSLLPKGFVMTGHDVTLRGVCARCL